MTFLPRAAAHDKRFAGVVIGTVADNRDPEKVGRVKVRLPWYASGYAEWARVAQIYAGKGYGSTWVPETETEVLVAFLHGDMRFPYVLGGLHSKAAKPSVQRSATRDVKTLRTPAGSELSFDEGKGVIDLKTPGGASIRLEEKSGAITLTAKQSITLEAPQIKLDASSKVTIKGAQVAIN